jgi:hypothetical protein
MNKPLVLTAAGVVAAGFAATGNGATTPTKNYNVQATMTAKQLTKPHAPKGKLAKAHGALVGKVSVGKSSSAQWTLTFSGLSGKVTAADVRYPGSGNTMVIRLCSPCKSGTKFVTTFPPTSAGPTFVREALAGKANVVLTTQKNPGGEVAGVVKARNA